jgi:ABC-2 type transport system ATP-binding protein
MRGTILEIRCSDSRKCARLLREHLTGVSVGLFGDRAHLVTDDPERGKAEAEELLKRYGIEPLGIRTVEPSLEDVFVSVVSRENT